MIKEDRMLRFSEIIHYEFCALLSIKMLYSLLKYKNYFVYDIFISHQSNQFQRIISIHSLMVMITSLNGRLPVYLTFLQ